MSTLYAYTYLGEIYGPFSLKDLEQDLDYTEPTDKDDIVIFELKELQYQIETTHKITFNKIKEKK